MRFIATYGENGNYMEVYKDMKNHLPSIPKDDSEYLVLVAACHKNMWLRPGGIPFEDDPIMDNEYAFEFVMAEDLAFLEMYFDHGNWSIRNGVIYKDLAFVNQVNGGDEWATFKRDKDGTWFQFESWTFGPSIEAGSFILKIVRMSEASPLRCKNLTY